MKKPFAQLIKQWKLADDISLEDLLKHSKDALKFTPDDPELVYTIAELYRHTGDKDKANQYYQRAIKLTDARTLARSKALEARLDKKRDNMRATLLLLLFVPIIASVLVATLGWFWLSKPEPLPADADPQKFAFTKWLAKQQMVQVMTTLQQQNPELTFDFSRPSSQSPMDFMKSMMQPDALERLKRQQKQANSKGEKGDGVPAFQCKFEPAVHCAAKDIPSAPGEKREEVVLLMEAYRSILDTEKDCEKLEASIKSIGNQLQWRKSERGIKADLEDFATVCFYKQKNIEKTIEHARKLQCIGDDGYINSVYWYLTAIQHYSGDKERAHKSYQCFQEATDHIENNSLFGPAYIASRHRESGALAWLYFDDLATATAELKKGRAILQKVSNKTRTIRDVIGEINLDLMETYVTANVDLETFQELHEEINSSGRLTDGYKQIKDTLASIYYMQNNNNQAAQVSLNNVVSRFKLMPEYICGWDWSGFRRGLKESISDDSIREQATVLVDASNCYVEQSNEKRIQQVNSVFNWLRKQ